MESEMPERRRDSSIKKILSNQPLEKQEYVGQWFNASQSASLMLGLFQKSTKKCKTAVWVPRKCIPTVNWTDWNERIVPVQEKVCSNYCECGCIIWFHCTLLSQRQDRGARSPCECSWAQMESTPMAKLNRWLPMVNSSTHTCATRVTSIGIGYVLELTAEATNKRAASPTDKSQSLEYLIRGELDRACPTMPKRDGSVSNIHWAEIEFFCYCFI